MLRTPSSNTKSSTHILKSNRVGDALASIDSVRLAFVTIVGSRKASFGVFPVPWKSVASGNNIAEDGLLTHEGIDEYDRGDEIGHY